MHSRTFASWQNWYFCQSYLLLLLLLREDKYSIREVVIKGNPVNLGDGEGLQVPSKSKLTGGSKFVNILQNFFKTKKYITPYTLYFFYLHFKFTAKIAS